MGTRKGIKDGENQTRFRDVIELIGDYCNICGDAIQFFEQSLSIVLIDGAL